MPKKPKPTKKPRPTNKAKKLKTNDPSVTSMEHYNAVLLEDINSKMETVIEYMGSVKNELIQRMDERFDEHDRQFEIIGKVLRHHSERFDAMDKRFDTMDKRFDAMDIKFDALSDKVQDHDITLKNLSA